MIIVCILRARVLGLVYTVFAVVTFEVEVLLDVSCFVVGICDDLAIYVFYEDV